MSPEDVDLDDSPLEGSKDVGRQLEEDGGIGWERSQSLRTMADLYGFAVPGTPRSRQRTAVRDSPSSSLP